MVPQQQDFSEISREDFFVTKSFLFISHIAGECVNVGFLLIFFKFVFSELASTFIFLKFQLFPIFTEPVCSIFNLIQSYT